jgi:hypothetical protein
MNRIRMKEPHYLAGTILERYNDKKPKKLSLGGGITVTIREGDYVNGNTCIPAKFLFDNIHMWEKV